MRKFEPLTCSVDVICALTTLVFLCTDFPTCYSPECGFAIKIWLVSVYVGFYGLQLLTWAYFRIKSRRCAFYVWLFTTAFVLPCLLLLNLWGNLLIERMDSVP